MAALIDADRKTIWQRWMSDVSSRRGLISMGKADLRDAVDAIDVWIDDNQASFNSSIPEPARSSLTAKQKAELLMFIVRRRWEVT